MNEINLLLIDNRVNDMSVVISSANTNTSKYIVIDYETDTYSTICQKISDIGVSNYSSVGVFQENYENQTYQFVKSFGESILADVQSQDSELSTWTQFSNLLGYLKSTYGVSNVDLMGCSIYADPNWNYVINKLSTSLLISIESSIDNTGSSLLDGNWILESNNSDMVNKYFTSSINNYQFILGPAYQTTSSTGGIVLTDGTSIRNLTTKFVDSTGNAITGIVAVSLGHSSDMILTNDGSVYVIGRNTASGSSTTAGMLAQGDSVNSTTTSFCIKMKKSNTSLKLSPICKSYTHKSNEIIKINPYKLKIF
jgi:hypothetical protein